MSSKTDAVVKLGIAFSITLLSFSIGVFAGKKYSDNQYQLAALEPQKNSAHADRAIASTTAGSPEGRSGAMTDAEIAKLAEEFVADETVPANSEKKEEAEHGSEGHAAAAPTAEAHGEAAPHAAAAATEDSHKPAAPAHHEAAPTAAIKAGHDEPSIAAKNMVEGKAPTNDTAVIAKKETPAAVRVPTSLPKDVAQFSVGKFTVQVASYPRESEAQQMASDLKSKGYSAFYIPANIKGQTYFRVSVGQFNTQKEAMAYRSEFISKAKIESAIVQKISE